MIVKYQKTRLILVYIICYNISYYQIKSYRDYSKNIFFVLIIINFTIISEKY